jgi:cell shape-determining protein MreC
MAAFARQSTNRVSEELNSFADAKEKNNKKMSTEVGSNEESYSKKNSPVLSVEASPKIIT